MRGLAVSAILAGAALAGAMGLTGMAAPPTSFTSGAHPEDAAIVQHLNVAITWYRQLATANEAAGEPSDAYYLDNARSLAKQALLLAFQSADAEAALLSAEKGNEASGPDSKLSSQSLGEKQDIAQSAARTAALIDQIGKQIATLDGQIVKATGKKLQVLGAQRENLQEQLDFDKTLQDALEKLSSFMSSSSGKEGGLRSEIDDLKKSVPELFEKAPAKEAANSPAASSSITPSPSTGLISQASILFSRLSDLREIRELIDGAGRVVVMARAVQSPLRTRLRATIDEGRGLANQSLTPDPAAEAASRQKMSSITTQFKQISSSTLPLAQEIILLNESQISLRQWESSVHRGYIRVLESFLTRVAVLLLGIVIVLGLSELWRRATFRYVREPLRRHQLLLLRRIVTGILMAIVLTLGFISEFNSLATFAGFLTAGIAVALQTLILSVAAYFFLIGRHGVRVGDRITVSGVTGDVIDVGPVRLYLMELGGVGYDLYPTGRVVVVSNSVLFQGVPFFKQIPGTAYAWHEVVVKLQPGGDYAQAEKKLLEAVNAVYAQYRDSLEQQHQALEGLVAIPLVVPSPQARLQLENSGLELAVRYPVALHREAETDNQMIRKIVETIQGDPELKVAVGSPTIRASGKS